MKTSAEIRQSFLDFFKEKQHHILPSAPIVIKNDPTLMFTNAGMNQFKDIFLDIKKPAWLRVANTQKCLRVSGKHNDLEEVGLDGYHHTMFEMLGNWSFGDYFKREAIYWAYEYLTQVCGISSDILYATYFEGDVDEGLDADEEAHQIWCELLPSERVLAGSKKDNFWEMGDTGPCGPCSEIHIDLRSDEQRKQVPGHLLVNKGNPEVIELWNLVFIQFHRDAQGKLHQLSKKHVDTGMGFERLCRVIQQKPTNYHTDLFLPIIQRIEELTSFQYGMDERADIAFRVIADHIRAVSFAIADGQLPSNVKAGYVVRRIMRRAIRYGYSYLKMDMPFIHALVPVLVDVMGDVFSELKKQAQLVERIVEEEEKAFLRTLRTGVHLFEDYIQKYPDRKVLDGKFAFELYDTYGFPIDLTSLMCRERGLSVDTEEFEQLLEEQRQRSRKDAQVDAGDWIIVGDTEKTEFIGWDTTVAEVQIVRARKVVRKGKEQYHLVFNKTPFYAESGGQIGDRGTLERDGKVIYILDTFQEFDLIIHVADSMPDDLENTWLAKVDQQLRMDTARNHTATHLLHYALRTILGLHVEQKGSLVHPEYLRFDFSHYSKLTDEEIKQIEMLVNELIMNNIPLQEQRSVTYEEALKQGAIALFGEKYDDVVRVVQFGDSKELCGGTHVQHTGQIGLFLITSESSIAAGVRRIEAVTGRKALQYVQTLINDMKLLAAELNNPRSLLESVQKIKQQHKMLEKEYEELLTAYARQIAEQMKNSIQIVQGVGVLMQKTHLKDQLFKNVCHQLKKTLSEPFYGVLYNTNNQVHQLAIIISTGLVQTYQLHAGKLIQELSAKFQGKGGGQPDMAFATLKSPENESSLFEYARNMFFQLKASKEA